MEWSDAGVEGMHRFLKRVWAYAKGRGADFASAAKAVPAPSDWKRESKAVRDFRHLVHSLLKQATFDYELADTTGKVLAKDFVTATSGNGMRGTFEFEVPYTLASRSPGTLTVFEISAANGKRIHAVEIPLELGAS